jgi:hypothetical protein
MPFVIGMSTLKLVMVGENITFSLITVIYLILLFWYLCSPMHTKSNYMNSFQDFNYCAS